MIALNEPAAPRVVHLLWNFSSGGMERRLVEQLNAAPGHYEQHLVIVNDQVEMSLLASVDAHVVPHLIRRPPGGLSPVPFARLNRIIAKLQPAVVICHSASLVKCLVVKPSRLVLHLHDTREPLRSVGGRYDAHIAASSEIARHILAGVPGSQPVLVHDGIRHDGIVMRGDWEPDTKFRIVQVGRLEADKGQDVLLRALARMRAQRPAMLFAAHFIGGGSRREQLEALARELCVEDRVRFLGPMGTDFVHQHLHRYDLLALPTRSGGLGTPAVEAAFARVPVLTSALPGPMDVIGGGTCGWAFRPCDVEHCAWGIMAVADAYRSRAIEVVVGRARQRAVENFALPVATARLAALYRNLASDAPPARRGPRSLEHPACVSC